MRLHKLFSEEQSLTGGAILTDMY